MKSVANCLKKIRNLKWVPVSQKTMGIEEQRVFECEEAPNVQIIISELGGVLDIDIFPNENFWNKKKKKIIGPKGGTR